MEIIRLQPEDTERFLAFRANGLASEPHAFRYAPEDDVALSAPAWRARLRNDVVVAAKMEDAWLGIGGLARLTGSRLRHKGLIWGMYVVPDARGTGAANGIMTALVSHAHDGIRQLQLTVMADNARARVFYERHGFKTYAIEPASVRRGATYADEALMWRHL